MMSENFILELVLVLFVSCGDAHRILLVPVTSQSHMACLGSIGEALADRGHQVHMVVPKDYPIPSASLEAAVTVERYDRPVLDPMFDVNVRYENFTRMILEDRAEPDDLLRYISGFSAKECRLLLMHNEPLMQRLSALRFDLAVVDGLFLRKCLYLLPHRLQIPWVTMTDTFEPWLARVPWLPSFVPSAVTTFSDKMTFPERVRNLFATVVSASVSVVPDPADDILDRYRTYGNFDTIHDLPAKSLLWIITSEPILDYARPLMPNMIEAGGLITRPAKADLPENIRAFVDNAKKGVILVSFGTMVDHLPPPMTEKFISGFSQLEDYQIIWRLDIKNGIKLPKNLLALQWLPQNEILAHPKTKLFITHCGNNGQYEALYHGVPMLGFPLHGDQSYNAKRMVHKGFGLSMSIHEFVVEELVSNVNRILSNATFKATILKASEIFKSASQTPREKAAWWVEHMAKFGGGHLGSAGNDLSIFQYLMLDVLGFVVAAVVV